MKFTFFSNVKMSVFFLVGNSISGKEWTFIWSRGPTKKCAGPKSKMAAGFCPKISFYFADSTILIFGQNSLTFLKRTVRAFQNIFYFCPSSNSLGDMGLQRSRTGVARTKKGPKKGPNTQKYRFFGFSQKDDPHYFLILGGVSIQRKAVT